MSEVLPRSVTGETEHPCPYSGLRRIREPFVGKKEPVRFYFFYLCFFPLIKKTTECVEKCGHKV